LKEFSQFKVDEDIIPEDLTRDNIVENFSQIRKDEYKDKLLGKLAQIRDKRLKDGKETI
jgi:hypothetical protein